MKLFRLQKNAKTAAVAATLACFASAFAQGDDNGASGNSQNYAPNRYAIISVEVDWRSNKAASPTTGDASS